MNLESLSAKIGESFLNDLLIFLNEAKLSFKVQSQNDHAFLLEFDVWAKPGSSQEKFFVGVDGQLVIQTRAKPIDGQANSAIIQKVASIFGVSRSDVEILRGDKSRNKRIKLLVEITAKKKKKYYAEKFTLLVSNPPA